MNARRPNILFIMSDEHRADCLGCYGNSEIRTPHLDDIAGQGVRFETAFCPYPVCTPSRYSLLSGLFVHEHRGWTNRSTLSPGIDTFPSLLKAAGYRTTAVGKMHFTPAYLDVGFERMILAEQDGPGRWDDDYHRELRSLGLFDANDLEDQRPEYRKQARSEYWKTLGAMPSNLPAKHHSTEWIGGKALEVLDEWQPEGNLLLASFIKPHHPFDPPHEWCDSLDPEKISLLPGWTPQCFPHDIEFNKGYFPHESLSESTVRKATAYYYAAIEHIDSLVGRMVELLKKRGLYDNTLILYTSDHGEYMGFHHLLLKSGYMYDPLVRVPLMIKFPDGRDAGKVSRLLASNIDLAPTLLKQAGCEPSPRMKGLDLASSGAERNVVFAEAGHASQTMARSKRFKLIHTGEPKKTLFYDLEHDPFELADLHEDTAYQKDRKDLEEALAGWRDPDLKPDVFLDENAPVIKQANVPDREDGHRESIEAYYRQKMEEWSKSNPR
jgi:arylsulfatase A-like enzyme